MRWILYPLLILIVLMNVSVANQNEIAADFPLENHVEEPVSRGAVRTLWMEVTAYSEHYESCGKHPWEKGYGITASGEKVRKGIVAADTSVLPMHSIIYIEGIGKLEVKDTGGAIRGNKLDLYLPSHEDAVKWGRKKLKVHVLKVVE